VLRVTDLSRRALLGLAAAVPLAACTADEGPPPPPDPDDLLRAAAVERERALLAMYDGLAVLPPAFAAVRAEHAEHLAALLGEQPSPAPSAAPAAPVAPPALVAAEREAGAAHARAALGASRELAALLASLSASETSHPVALA
jgi:hypothetical protein